MNSQKKNNNKLQEIVQGFRSQIVVYFVTDEGYKSHLDLCTFAGHV